MPRIINRIQTLSASLLVIAGVLLAIIPDHADAATCASRPVETPFQAWDDDAKYVLAPDGGFEAQGDGWTLTGGAAAKQGNEPFFVRSPADAWSLSLPAGSSATSPAMCIDLAYPTLRFFSRKVGPADARLAVNVGFRTPDGTPRQVKIADLAPGVAWEPTRAIHILANLLALNPSWDGYVAFRFVATSGDSAIDDVYVDPYER